MLGRARSASAFANYAGVAPIEVASGDHVRHRLPRGGDRQLNLALHIVALTQVRMRESTGRAYYDTQIVAGKSHNEAMRCLKRRLAERFWRLMLSDEHRLAAGWRGEGGDVAGAVTEFERLLTAQQRVLGADHPGTLTTRNNLAFWRGEGGDVADDSSV